uniref:Reverse transcriptase/retrotransposon-derived protein RNase H-like domain-containing protein n=1 Tax=Pipistrellus kuhlii TaxID=59472 RepID=A0A7J7U9X9_PIPKU|nr:hypothetical protein mPipKuh1_009140 [Pipistrellus kuhlii]
MASRGSRPLSQEPRKPPDKLPVFLGHQEGLWSSEGTRTGGMQLLNWSKVEQRIFEELKKALISAAALALLDDAEPFHLYVSEVRGIAKGVLTQTLGPWKGPVAYLSKRLDPVAATALLVKEADKWTLDQELTWMGQAFLLDQPCVQIQKTLAINPASLLPDDDDGTHS